jgi:hypothetical protein
MNIEKCFIDISPKKTAKCCQNCKSFGKYGVHLGYCILNNKEMLDNQKCNKFEFEPNKKDDL